MTTRDEIIALAQHNIELQQQLALKPVNGWIFAAVFTVPTLALWWPVIERIWK